MTSTDAAPTLLPGTPASTWQRAVGVMAWLLVPAVILAGMSGALDWRGGFVWFVPFVVIFVMTYVVFLFQRRRNRKELAAGYTTLWHSNPTVLQLDGATGEVVRGAGQPFVSKRAWRNHDVDAAQASAAPLAKPTFLQRMLPAVPFFLVVLFVTVIGIAVGAFSHSVNLALGLSVAGALVAVIVLATAIAALVSSGRLKRMKAAAPNAFIFLFTNRPAYRVEAAAMDWHGGAGGMAASADAAGVTLWTTDPPTVAGFLSWDRVVGIQAVRVDSGNSWLPTVLISYKDRADAMRAVELSNANADRAAFRSMPEARWIASVLNEFRSGTSTARVL